MELLKQEITRRRSAPAEQILQARTNGPLALRVSGPIDVGRIRQQQQHAALAVFGERVQIEELVVGRRGIDLKIAGMNHHPERCGDRQRDAAHNRVRNVDKFDCKRTELDPFARLHHVQGGIFEHLVLFQTAFYQCQREFGSVNRNVQLRQQKRHAANVVFVAVRQDQPADQGGMLFQIGEIGSDDVYPEQLGIREHHARVDHDDVVAIAERHRIHAEFAETTKRDNFEFLVGHGRSQN